VAASRAPLWSSRTPACCGHGFSPALAHHVHPVSLDVRHQRASGAWESVRCTALCRVPMGPRAGTAAPGAGATSAPARVSGWTSMPIKRGRDGALVARRRCGVDVATSRGTGGGKRTRVIAGGNLPPWVVLMSRRWSPASLAITRDIR